MVILVYLNSALLECGSESKDMIIKTKLTVDKASRLAVFYKKSVLRNLAKLSILQLY